MLGDRLASSDNSELSKQAEICFLCSGNLNKMIESSDSSIQEKAELVTIMQKALELQGTSEVVIEGQIASILSQYAEMLASEGNFESALNYLGNSQEPRIAMLRDRLYRALGYIQDARPRQSQSYYQQQQQQQQRKSLPTNIYNPVQMGNNWNTTPLKQSYPSTANHFGTPLVPSLSSAPPPLDQFSNQASPYGQISTPQAPPPPPTASNLSGSRPPSVGPQSRSKYIIDPSVKSAPTYGGMSNYQQPSMFGAQSNSVSSFPAQNTFQANQAPLTNSPYSNPVPNSMFNAQEQSGLMAGNQQTQSQIYDPSRGQVINQPQVYDNPYQPIPQPAGWNDPPISNKPTRMQVIKILFYKFY